MLVEVDARRLDRLMSCRDLSLNNRSAALDGKRHEAVAQAMGGDLLGLQPRLDEISIDNTVDLAGGEPPALVARAHSYK